MDSRKIQLITGALLHDLGKVALRAGAGEVRQDHSTLGANLLKEILQAWPEAEPTLECVRYHHSRQLDLAKLKPDHPAWIVCEADNIAAGTDRRERPTEGDVQASGASFKSTKCLDSVFNLVRTTRRNQDSQQEFKLVYGRQEESNWIAPLDSAQKAEATPAEYAAIWSGISQSLSAIDWGNSSYLNSIHSLLEGYLSYVPSSTDTRQVADISLFDHSVMTAAVASCIYDWAEDQGISDLENLCFRQVNTFRNQPVFQIVHADMSGIQDFIYTISSKRALKSLRGRSFYLEIILEQIADEILQQLELTRANLLYTGGGGFYLILPNTKKAEEVLRQASDRFNTWLRDQFSIDLYLGLAWRPATASHFMDSGKPNRPGTAEVFREVSEILSVGKLQRYRGNGLMELFTPERPQHGDRECTVCGKSNNLVANHSGDGEDQMVICGTCQGLIELGTQLIKDTAAEPDQKLQFVVTTEKPRYGMKLQLPALTGEAWLSLVTTTELRDILKASPDKVIRIYSKNHRSTGLEVSTRLWVGDYNHCAINSSGAVEFKDFVDMRGDQGIGRIAVLRADVDNLGSLFAGGFRGESPDKATYETLGRYATLSRSLSRFFKSHINHIAQENQRNLVLVYAGGDDIFAVGAWDEVIDFAIDLRERFAQFTSDKLSFSAGIGFFRYNFPISRMAELTGDLENMAKRGSKDQVALFGVNIREGEPVCRHVYDWQRLKAGVLPKRDFLLDQLNVSGSTDEQDGRAGLSFLYKINELLVTAEENDKDRLPLARLAYLIARREPSAHASDESKGRYAALKDKLYRWAMDPTERQELITAIMICAYSIRKKGE